MASITNRVPVPGSERTPLPGARAVGTPHPEERIEVTVDVRSRAAIKGLPAAEPLGAIPPHQRQHLSREAFAEMYGADRTDLAKVEAFAHEHGLTVVEVSVPKRTVKLSGTVADLSAAFGVYLANYEHPGGTYRGRVGPVQVPADLADIVVAVRGLDNRPQATPHFRLQSVPQAGSGSFTPLQVAQLYDFPSGLNGQGQCIALIELGGGYRPRDLTTYFTRLGLPTPTVTAISVDGGQNHPTYNPNGPDGEVMLDIEVAGAVAPGATIAVYFAPNTDRGFVDAIKAAIHDTQHTPSVLSISWGSAESNWTRQSLQAMDQAFQEAAVLGVTVCCAAGDSGSSDGVNDGQPHVDFPASDPYVLGCGGTRLTASGGSISREVVWNEGAHGGATGGGVSTFFPLPAYQNAAQVPSNPHGQPGRGVPDVAGDADPASGYQIEVDGRLGVIGGTSAVAPLWAGLIALINQQLGHPVGYLNPLLYSPQLNNAGGFHEITSGNNDMNGNLGVYQARQGWNACTGLGSPDGAKLLQVLTAPAGQVAGEPPRREPRGGRA